MKNTKRFLVIAVMAIVVVSLCATMFMSCDQEQDISIYLVPDKAEYTVGVCQLVQHVALDAATQGFVDALTEEMEAAGKKVTVDVQNASGDPAICSTIANKFVSSKYDLIMANATPALQAAANATLTIPVLGTSITEYGTALGVKDFTGTLGNNISGTSDCAPLDKQADMIFELIPTAKKVGILYCSSEANSKYQVEQVEKFIKQNHKDVTIVKKSFSDTNDLASVVSSFVGAVDAVYIPTDNTCANNAASINAILEPARIPVIAGEEGIAKGCGVATLSISYYDLGKVTGHMAAQILLGKNVALMPIEYASSTTYEYVASRCTALGITVPDNYVAINE